MSRALIVVDVQPTFCEGGALPVDGGNACAERIARFVAERGGEYALVATTQDWHIDPGKHFSSAPDVAGTPEAELHPALADLHADIRVKKGQYCAAYSGFEGVAEDGASLEEALRAAGITEVDVVGLAQSHCVCETALDAKRAGFEVRVLSDLTEPVSVETGATASKRLSEAGIAEVASAPLS